MSGINRVCFIAAVVSAGLSYTRPARAGGVESIVVIPTEDTFSRALSPTATYGAAGALHVSGTASMNAAGQQQGEADTWMRFDTTGALAQLDAIFGAGNWTLDSVILSMREVASPNNPLFTRGSGDFDVSWIANDDWSEGPGTAGAPGTAVGNQIGWAHGQLLLGAGDRALGSFQNAAANTRQDFALTLEPDFVADLLSPGADLTFRLSAASPGIGFTFNASTNIEQSRPQLVINAVPEPATILLLPVALALSGFHSRRRSQSSE